MENEGREWKIKNILMENEGREWKINRAEDLSHWPKSIYKPYTYLKYLFHIGKFPYVPNFCDGTKSPV